jgi:hypothetical protein
MPSLTFFDDDCGELVAAAGPSDLEVLSSQLSRLQREVRGEVPPRPVRPQRPKKARRRCGNCKKHGHYRTTCAEPQRRLSVPPATAAKAVPPPESVRITRVPARTPARVVEPELLSPPFRREQGSSGRRCPWCADLGHRRPPTGCVGCGRPFVAELVTLNTDGVSSSAGLLLEE